MLYAQNMNGDTNWPYRHLLIIFLKIFFILTPFFCTFSISLTHPGDSRIRKKKQIAFKVTIAVMISTFVIYLFGKYIFLLFGITLDAFRIGAAYDPVSLCPVHDKRQR